MFNEIFVESTFVNLSTTLKFTVNRKFQAIRNVRLEVGVDGNFSQRRSVADQVPGACTVVFIIRGKGKRANRKKKERTLTMNVSTIINLLPDSY